VSEREWRFYVDDMIGFVEKEIVYTDGLDQNQFLGSSLNYDAIVRNLEVTVSGPWNSWAGDGISRFRNLPIVETVCLSLLSLRIKGSVCLQIMQMEYPSSIFDYSRPDIFYPLS
jgi:hypothetical protein